MKLFLVLYFSSLFFFTNSISLEIDCQGAILRILDKTTNEKTFFTVPLSQTIELKNSNIVVHKCIKIEREGKNEEIALISHNHFGAIDSETKFLVGFSNLLNILIHLIIPYMILNLKSV